MKSLLTLAVLAGLAGSAEAVVLNPRGSGQVLLYPYYTVNAGNNTLLTIANTDDTGLGRGKAIRVVFREGENGRPVLQFNVYLNRHATFAATVFANGDGAALVPAAGACTFPAIASSTTLPQLPDGRRYIAFDNANYTGTADDPGVDGLVRTREGWIEAYETGTITPASAGESAVLLCEIDALWNGGVWSTNPGTYLTNPSGGLMGAAAIINVARGTIANVPATALADFRVDDTNTSPDAASVLMHSRPDQPPMVGLDRATNDPAVIGATAILQGTSGSARLRYVHPVDAVTAVLMANAALGEFDTDVAVGSSTSIVMTYPTRRHYTDSRPPATHLQPFSQVYAGIRTNALDVPVDEFFDLDGYSFASNCGFLCPPTEPSQFPGTSVEVAPVFADNDPLLSSRLGARLSRTPTILTRDHGSFRLGYPPTGGLSGAATLPASVEGVIVHGVPVIGFTLTNYVNANVQGGVLANYSAATPLRTVNDCDGDGGPCN